MPVSGQKPPRQKPPGHKPPTKTPQAKNPLDKNPPEQILTFNFFALVFFININKVSKDCFY